MLSFSKYCAYTFDISLAFVISVHEWCFRMSISFKDRRGDIYDRIMISKLKKIFKKKNPNSFWHWRLILPAVVPSRLWTLMVWDERSRYHRIGISFVIHSFGHRDWLRRIYNIRVALLNIKNVTFQMINSPPL